MEGLAGTLQYVAVAAILGFVVWRLIRGGGT